MRIYLFLAEGFEEIEVIAPVDIFRRANLEVLTVSITDNRMVEGAHGIRIEADQIFSEIQFSGEFMIFLPGGMPGTLNLDNFQPLRDLITLRAGQGKKIAAICAAPSILGKLGVLNGREAICYPGFEKFLTDAAISDSKIVKDDFLFTAKGPGVAIPFALKIVEDLSGNEKAEEVANALML
jgi:4-methyl-5(b-hydroxyethyl)-thiazole monophosphate biosynthesis